uniref:Uncharacterized protein n=1 Tax=Anguilla anguilla TaxID=7936 RepID=A0A0E9U858_ANGAN
MASGKLQASLNASHFCLATLSQRPHL